MADRNLLLYGDNLPFLLDTDLFPSESVDLIYLDPPFNSNANYNVLFKAVSGEPSSAQIKAFDDTWTWDQSANAALFQLMEEGHAGDGVKSLVKTFHSFLGHSPMLAYLVQMAMRLVHLRRVLRSTGSLYLHCDPTASHYLKLVLDGIFGAENFRNEIVWRRTNSHNKLSRQYGPIHDTILFYAKSDDAVFHLGTRPYMKKYVETSFPHRDKRGMYQLNNLTGPGVRSGECGKAWRGYNPTKGKRHWAIPLSLRPFLKDAGRSESVLEALESLYAQGFIVFPDKDGGQPRYKQYPGDGVLYQDVWAFQPSTQGLLVGTNEGIDEDVKYLDQDDEKLGYPTQKPIGLLKRILRTSSNPGAVVLDPFCGCGTTIDAVETLNREHPTEKPRRWIGIDVTHVAVNLIKARLTRFDPAPAYRVVGEPIDAEGATALFKQDPFQFQFWACGLVGARPFGSLDGKTGKRGADRGIDGVRYFVDDNTGPKTILVQVKGGKSGARDVRDFRGTIEREQAALGILVLLSEPTKEMQKEASTLAPYVSTSERKGVPRLQIVTIEQLLAEGTPSQPGGVVLPRGVEASSSDKTLKKAKRHDAGGLFIWGSQ
ncbi:MAG: restriction endonuclease [Phycisphaerales bacterium]|nr:restriction endonuclease [Phycisphaerales bacterium]